MLSHTSLSLQMNIFGTGSVYTNENNALSSCLAKSSRTPCAHAHCFSSPTRSTWLHTRVLFRGPDPCTRLPLSDKLKKKERSSAFDGFVHSRDCPPSSASPSGGMMGGQLHFFGGKYLLRTTTLGIRNGRSHTEYAQYVIQHVNKGTNTSYVCALFDHQIQCNGVLISG